MTAADLLVELVEAGVVLWLDGEQIRYRAPSGALDQWRRDLVVEHRSALVDLLLAGLALPRDVDDWPDSARESFEERAAILEFDGGLARVTAEREAARLVRVRFAGIAPRSGTDPP